MPALAGVLVGTKHPALSCLLETSALCPLVPVLCLNDMFIS